MSLIPGSDEVMNLLRWVYDVVVEGGNKLLEYIKLLTATFPIDDSRRTLALSGIWFGLIVAVLLIFSTSSGVDLGGGVKDYDIDPLQLGDESLRNKDPHTGTTLTPGNETPQTQPPEGECFIDDDCQRVVEGVLQTPICCTPQKWSGYTCSGRCLILDSYTEDYCKHPNSCRDNTEATWFIENAQKDLNRCDLQPVVERANWCAEKHSFDGISRNWNSVCCDNLITPCHGYCGTDGINSCGDITKCDYEQMRTPYNLERTPQ